MPKQPHQVPMPLEAPEDVDLGTSFSLTNLLTKVRNEIGILGFREWDWDWEGKPHQVPTPLEAPEDVDLGTSFSLTNLLTKLRNGILGLANWLYLKQPHQVPTRFFQPN